MKLEKMSKGERSLLLYFEARAVDHRGSIDIRRMNAFDISLAKKWNDSGFVRFGRIAMHDVVEDKSHWCELSEEAWALAHQERKNRAKRMEKQRKWEKAGETRRF